MTKNALLLAADEALTPETDRGVEAWLDDLVERVMRDMRPDAVLLAELAPADAYLRKTLAFAGARVLLYCPGNLRVSYHGTKRGETVRWEGRNVELAMVRDLKQAQQWGWEAYAMTLVHRERGDTSLQALCAFLDWYQPLPGNPEEYAP